MSNEVKQRPDSPGVWWREGKDWPVHVWSYVGVLHWCALGASEQNNIADIVDGRWLKADLTPPEFPQLPEKPIRVLASCDGDDEEWWACFGEMAGPSHAQTVFINKRGWRRMASLLCVRVHEDNDPEAVAAIERAKQ